jgi:anti-sigma B factor antagonist
MAELNATATVVHITGDIDLNTSPALRAALSPALQSPVSRTVIFDLSAVSFIDSAGLAVLISVAEDGRTVLLRHPSDLLVRVIEATGLSETLPVER